MSHDEQHRQHGRSKPLPPGRESIAIGGRRRLRVEYVRNIDVIFHGYTEERHTLVDISYVPSLGFNLYSLYIQWTHVITSDASGTHIMGT